MSAHRRKHMTETLSNEEHKMAKRGELNWLATQSMIYLLALLSLIDTVEIGHWTESQRFESSCATGAL